MNDRKGEAKNTRFPFFLAVSTYYLVKNYKFDIKGGFVMKEPYKIRIQLFGFTFERDVGEDDFGKLKSTVSSIWDTICGAVNNAINDLSKAINENIEWAKIIGYSILSTFWQMHYLVNLCMQKAIFAIGNMN